MKSPIDKAEIEQFRHPSEYIRWFDLVVQHVIDEADETEVLLQQGIYKQIHQEIFPLATLLKAKSSDWSQSKFRNVIGPQPFDVEIQTSDCPLAYFEIACTIFDDGELYRMKEFLDKRVVSLTASLIRDGKEMKSGGHQVTEISALPRNRNHAIQEIVEKVKDQIIKKSKKDYPEQTGLIIYYDDCSHYFRGNDYDQIRSVCKETDSIWRNNFDALFAVGITNSELIEI
jgi:hypothetical protein